MAYAIGQWARFDHPSHIEFNQIGYRALGGGPAKTPRYTWVQIPNGMWSSSLSCQKASEQKQTPQGTVNCPQRLEPSGTQWIQIQWGWTYGERQVMTGLGPTGFSPRYHQSVPNVAAQTGSPCDPPGSFRPASVNQFTQQPGHEVLNTDINPRTGQPEKNFTKLAEGQACSIPEDAAGSLPKVRTFYTINANGTYAESKGWVARMGANGPYFVKEFPG